MDEGGRPRPCVNKNGRGEEQKLTAKTMKNHTFMDMFATGIEAVVSAFMVTV